MQVLFAYAFMYHKMTMSTYQYRNPAVHDMFNRLVIECDTSYILY